MKANWKLRAGLGLGAASLALVFAGAAFGSGLNGANRMWLTCQNGHDYPLRPVGVSPDDDLVTGYMLNTGARHAVYLRLVPMGNGYRYTGEGTWFDGVRGKAVLNWSRSDAVACKVMQD